MAKKPIDPVVSMVGRFQTTAQMLAADVEERGGNLAEAFVLLARPVYVRERKQIADILASVREPVQEEVGIVEEWAAFYAKHFPQELANAGGAESLYAVTIPSVRKGFTRLIVVLKGLTLNGVYAACEKHFPCWRYTDNLDASVTTSDRGPTTTYAVWVREQVEADKKFANKSANDLVAEHHTGITLLERMLYELKVFDGNGGHLDLRNVTLCTGSRYADGSVPDASWNDGEFRVYWTAPRRPYPSLRSRAVLSR